MQSIVQGDIHTTKVQDKERIVQGVQGSIVQQNILDRQQNIVL